MCRSDETDGRGKVSVGTENLSWASRPQVCSASVPAPALSRRRSRQDKCCASRQYDCCRSLSGEGDLWGQKHIGEARRHGCDSDHLGSNRHGAPFTPVGKRRSKTGVIHQPGFEPGRGAGESPGGDEQERRRRQERQENPCDAEHDGGTTYRKIDESHAASTRSGRAARTARRQSGRPPRNFMSTDRTSRREPRSMVRIARNSSVEAGSTFIRECGRPGGNRIGTPPSPR